MTTEFEEGSDAFRAGVSFEDCPYNASEPAERLEWEEGWMYGLIYSAMEKGEMM